MSSVDPGDTFPSEPLGPKVPNRSKRFGQSGLNFEYHGAMMFAQFMRLDRVATISVATGFHDDECLRMDRTQFLLERTSHIGNGSKRHLAYQSRPVPDGGIAGRIARNLTSFERDDLGHIARVDPAADFIPLKLDLSQFQSDFASFFRKELKGSAVAFGRRMG